jgi:hypothetical protein
MPQGFVAGASDTPGRVDERISISMSAKVSADDATRTEGYTDLRSWRVEDR